MTTLSTTTAPKSETWRSKLGQNYSKEYMQKNEGLLLQELHKLRDLPENRMCADCGTRGTVWASVNLGVFLCMACGSHHRSLGTHISLPKGCTGTYWWGPDEIERMRSIGNTQAQELYGNHHPENFTKEDTHKWREFLVDKYVNKRYAKQQEKAQSQPHLHHQSQQDLNDSSSWFHSDSLADIAPPPAPMSPKNRLARKSNQYPKAQISPDLIHFDSTPPAPTNDSRGSLGASPPPSPATFSPTTVTASKATGGGFFAEFGL